VCMDAWFVEAGPRGGVVVVSWVVCWVGEVPRLGSEPTASSLTSSIMLRDQSGIEPSC